jgi:hypothetical protein
MGVVVEISDLDDEFLERHVKNAFINLRSVVTGSAITVLPNPKLTEMINKSRDMNVVAGAISRNLGIGLGDAYLAAKIGILIGMQLVLELLNDNETGETPRKKKKIASEETVH